MSAALLTLTNLEEAGDVLEWMHAHHAEEDWPRETAATRDWLRDIIWNAEGWPCFAAVPAEHIEPLQYAIDDWSEVLASHDESLLSTLTVKE